VRKAAIGLGIASVLACLFRFTSLGGGYNELGSMVAFLFAALFAAMILVGLVSRVGHTPAGASALAAGAVLLCISVYWWLDLGKTINVVGLDETAAVAAAAPRPQGGAASPRQDEQADAR
jgi:hypothetical protein